MQLIDTHAHIYVEHFLNDLPLVLERAKKNDIYKIYMPNVDLSTIDPMMQVSTIWKDYCFPMVGIHPCYITKDFIKQLYQVEDRLSRYQFIGVGEIGIDLYHDCSLILEQKEAFAIQLDFSKQYKLPVSIHCRNAFCEVIEILSQKQDGSLKGVIHCFTGTLLEAETCINLGFKLGVGGILTMSKNTLCQVIDSIDLLHLVLETDSPYLTPVPYRGKRNEPAYLRYVAEKLACIKQVALLDVATITTNNAQSIFT